MKTNTTLLGLAIIGALFAGVGCEYYNGKDLATIDAATQKKIDDMTTKIEGLEDQLAAKQKEGGDPEVKKEPTAITIADFAGTWKATKYVISDDDKLYDLIALKEYESVELAISDDGTCLATVKPKGKKEVSVPFKLVLEDGKLHFVGLDKVQEEPFEYTLEGDAMDWAQPPLDDSVAQISWERLSQDAALPQALTIKDIAGKWDMTSYVVTDPKTGISADYVQAGYKTEIVIHDTDSTMDMETTYQGTTSKQQASLVMKDNHLTFDQMDMEITLEGDTMHWSGEVEIQSTVYSFEIDLKRAGI